MNPQPFAISKAANGYLLTLPGQPPQPHRFKRQALSHAIHATRPQPATR